MNIVEHDNSEIKKSLELTKEEAIEVIESLQEQIKDDAPTCTIYIEWNE